MALRLLFFILIGGHCAAAQNWQTSGADTFFTDSEGKICLQTLQGNGYAIRPGRLPDSPSRFWLKGDLWFSSDPETTDAFFVFGQDTGAGRRLWAAGYSLSEKQILFGALEISPGGEVQFRLLAKKTVEILNSEDKYVFMFIFSRRSDDVAVEVNGVPMAVKFPLPDKEFTWFGYMVRGGSVRFQPLEIAGD
ncbi:MAG: hypothetical protein HUU32_12430 [Calditrichaceae bacterium]|nr:hypothetical protein [Calditrichia bacterium]NUQ42195.1 hypothetical protein [Calditrichaceae bacterium]